MKLGEIKIEALRLMFAGDQKDMTVDSLIIMNYEEEYRDYLLKMPFAINRCFSLLEEKRVLPTKSVSINSKKDFFEGDKQASPPKPVFINKEIELPEDFFDVERIVYDGPDGYRSNCEYYREGDKLFIKNREIKGEYRLLYKPSLPRITSMTPNNEELLIPDRIACFIPYFIKAELFRMDEPDEANEARNWFEAAIESISNNNGGVQTHVEDKFSFEEV